jgi:signal transduction histidine kinase
MLSAPDRTHDDEQRPGRGAPGGRDVRAAEPFHVLVVDDVALNLDLAEEILRAEGYDVTRAASGIEALGRASRVDFDAILLDVQMPGMDGWEVCRRLMADAATREVPILFMTAAYGEDEDVIRGLELGARDYVTKPVHPRILLRRVEAAVRAHRASREQRELAEQRAEALRALTAAQARILEARKLAALSTMARGLAHEINNPLAAAMSNVAYALDDDDEADEAERIAALTDALDNMKRVAAIVDRMRVLGAEIDMGAPASLPDVLGPVLVPLVDEQRRRGVTLDLTLRPTPPVPGAVRLVPVVSELVTNAARAVRRGGRVDVACGSLGGTAMIIVSDDGAGMDAETKARAFEPFFTRKDDWRAIGLGLSMCHAIVTSLGGTISIDSAPDSGTRVTIRLPVLPPDETV